MKVNEENLYNLTFEKKIDVEFYVGSKEYSIPVIFKVRYIDEWCDDFELMSIDESVPQDIKEQFIIQYNIKELHNSISNKINVPITLDDFKDTWVYSTCEMITCIDVTTLCAWCDCKMKVIDGKFYTSSLHYFNVNAACLVQPFSHPTIWSVEGDSSTEELKDEWEWIKSKLTEQIHNGKYNYELAYKSFGLLD